MWDTSDEDPNLTRVLPFERDAFSYIEIMESPLIAKFFPGPMTHISRGKGQTLTLSPDTTHSLDPDYPEDKVLPVEPSINIFVFGAVKSYFFHEDLH